MTVNPLHPDPRASSTLVPIRREVIALKGSEKPKQLQKKAAQKTLKEKRNDKKAKAKAKRA